MIKQTLNYLRGRSPEAKNRIVLAVGAVAVLALGSAWLNTVKRELSGMDGSDLLPGQVAGRQVTANGRVKIESAEAKDGKLKIYFKVTNGTSDILAFSPQDKVTLRAGQGSAQPSEVIDRQGGPFVRKILSGSTAYGILVFPEPEKDSGTIEFDDMYFEGRPGELIRETLGFDLEELQPTVELRS